MTENKSEKPAAKSGKVTVVMGDHVHKAGQEVSVDQETADFLVEHGHASLK